MAFKLRSGTTKDSYFSDTVAADFRDSDEYKFFAHQVAEFIALKKSVTYRMLNKRFRRHRWILPALETLESTGAIKKNTSNVLITRYEYGAG